MPEPKLIGFRVDACFDSDAVTDTFCLRAAAVECARMLVEAGYEVGVWEVIEYDGEEERAAIKWRQK